MGTFDRVNTLINFIQCFFVDVDTYFSFVYLLFTRHFCVGFFFVTQTNSDSFIQKRVNCLLIRCLFSCKSLNLNQNVSDLHWSRILIEFSIFATYLHYTMLNAGCEKDTHSFAQRRDLSTLVCWIEYRQKRTQSILFEY